MLVRAGGYGIFLPETKPRFVLSVRVERFEFFWLGQKGTGLFPFELEGTAVFGFEPKLTGKKKFAPKLPFPTTGAHNPGVPVRGEHGLIKLMRTPTEQGILNQALASVTGVSRWRRPVNFKSLRF